MNIRAWRIICKGHGRTGTSLSLYIYKNGKCERTEQTEKIDAEIIRILSLLQGSRWARGKGMQIAHKRSQVSNKIHIEKIFGVFYACHDFGQITTQRRLKTYKKDENSKPNFSSKWSVS